MAIPTQDIKIVSHGDRQFKRNCAAEAGTYYVGELVMRDPASDTVMPVSASTTAGMVVAGMVTRQQVIANTGDNLEFKCGEFAFKPSGSVPGTGQLVFFNEISHEHVQVDQGTNNIFGGRFVQSKSGSLGGSSVGNRTWIAEIGLIGSGSAFISTT